ncbi:MAG: phage tail protein [Clostridia bacterium]|nr:phage tail protein [Clostridia bacterium]
MEEQKQFVIRNVNVPDGNDYVNRSNSNYSNTWDVVNDKLIDTNGGHLETGLLEAGRRYIDYLAEYTHINSQVIMFGENLLDITQYIKGENIRTAIIPLGEKNTETGQRLTIASVNDGKDYIYDETAVNLFGWIWDTVEYEDVTLPQNLLRKGQQYLSSVINETITIELSAVDLHHLNCDIEKFKNGDLVRVVSIPHKLDRYFLVSKLLLNLDNPKESILTLGQTFTTLTQNQNKENKILKESIIISNQQITKTNKEVNEVKQSVSQVEQIIVDIPTEFVKTEIFEDYKDEVDRKLYNVYTIKGSVASYSSLPITADNGDVYNVLDTGANYVYTVQGWDKLSETIDLSNYYTKTEADALFATILSLVAYLTTEDAEDTYTKLEDFEDLVARVEALENNGNGGI